MEALVLSGKYRNWKTKYYLGLKGGRFACSTRKRDLDAVLDRVLIRYRYSVMAAYCLAHNHILLAPACSDFHLRAAEKAQDCKEFDLFEDCWDMSRKLGEALLGDPEALRELPEALRRGRLLRKLAKLPELGEILRRLKGMDPGAVPPGVEERLVGLRLAEEIGP